VKDHKLVENHYHEFYFGPGFIAKQMINSLVKKDFTITKIGIKYFLENK
jgi:hypothetical protein